MAAKGQSKTAKIARWKLLEVRLRTLVTEQPHLAEAHAELQGLITEAETLESQFEIHRAAFRDTSSKRDVIAKAGDALRFRLSGALTFALGPENKLLLEYGLNPRRPGGRPAKTARAPKAQEPKVAVAVTSVPALEAPTESPAE
jgi:hypothetical protein